MSALLPSPEGIMPGWSSSLMVSEWVLTTSSLPHHVRLIPLTLSPATLIHTGDLHRRASENQKETNGHHPRDLDTVLFMLVKSKKNIPELDNEFVLWGGHQFLSCLLPTSWLCNRKSLHPLSLGFLAYKTVFSWPFGTLEGLVPGTLKTPKSADAQVSYTEWCSVFIWLSCIPLCALNNL